MAQTPTCSALAQGRSSWPTQDWTSSPVNVTAKAAEIRALEQEFFTLTGKDRERIGLRTDALLIVKKGVIVYEKYARGYTASNPHISWSVAKSISSTLVGIASGAGALQLDDSICKYLTEYASKTEVCKIRVRDAITFGTGLKWQEGYEDGPRNTSSVISMLLGEGYRNQLKFLLGHAIAAAPGAQWLYSTGDAELAAALAKRALEPAYGANAFFTVLFNRIGMWSAVLEQDATGTPQGGSNFYATPRDYAKFGYLFLNGGCWEGQWIVPPGWVEVATTPSENYVANADDAQDVPSGYMWWLNKPTSARATPVRSAKDKPWKDAPDDAYTAIGHWGQYVVVVPSKDMVIVRTGDDRNANVNINTLITLSDAVAQ